MVNRKNTKAPIGIFDSGFGGLTVFRAIKEALPREDIIYLGDAARLPYGSKSPETVERYTLQCAKWLEKSGVKMIIIACHTASSLALPSLHKHIKIPVIGMVSPSLPALIEKAKYGKVAILGTNATITSGIYQSALRDEGLDESIIPVACPLFAPLIEEGLINSSISKECVEHYLSSLKSCNLAAALLACTHYPLLQDEIQQFLGISCQVIDPALLCAQNAGHLLQNEGLLSSNNHEGTYTFFTTDDPVRFKALGERFLKHSIPSAEKLQL